MYKVDVYLRVRRAVMVDGMSIREASRVFGLHRDTVRKMLAFSVPPGVLTFREKVLANWPAEMSHSTYGECDFDAQRTDETQDSQQPAG